jgi:hypothetical protein
MYSAPYDEDGARADNVAFVRSDGPSYDEAVNEVQSLLSRSKRTLKRLNANHFLFSAATAKATRTTLIQRVVGFQTHRQVPSFGVVCHEFEQNGRHLFTIHLTGTPIESLNRLITSAEHCSRIEAVHKPRGVCEPFKFTKFKELSSLQIAGRCWISSFFLLPHNGDASKSKSGKNA